MTSLHFFNRAQTSGVDSFGVTSGPFHVTGGGLLLGLYIWVVANNVNVIWKAKNERH
jgi:hypothetical protein